MTQAPDKPVGARKPCCVPGTETFTETTVGVQPAPLKDRASRGPPLTRIRGGEFQMGTDTTEGFAADGEGPSRLVRVSDFAISSTCITNRQFRQFVADTAYITEAEQAGGSFVFHLQVPAALRAAGGSRPTGLPWWLSVDDACWQRPEGPGSHIYERLDHPVVHVSWHDALAYAEWAGARLPTEAQWEYAARGGLAGRRYPWGDEPPLDGEPRCQIFRGSFPDRPDAGWTAAPIAADAFAPNGFGLFQMAGNVWQWCADWFSPRYHRETPALDPVWREPTGERSMRGGSFLCHDSYCNRYRVAARTGNTPGSATSNCGFRIVADPR